MFADGSLPTYDVSDGVAVAVAHEPAERARAHALSERVVLP
jgi:hypothetical protein